MAKDVSFRFTPLEMVWFRVMLSAVLMGSFFLVRHGAIPRLSRADLVKIALLGLVGVTINQGFFMWGISYSTPLHASLLYAFTPVMVMLGSFLWLNESATPRRLMGIVVSIVGVALVLTARGLDLAEGPFRGDLLVLVAVAAWAAYTLLGKDVLRRCGTLTVVAGSFLAGALWLLPATPWVLQDFQWADPGVRGWLGIGYLSAVTSGIAFTLWYWGLKRLEAAETAVFTNLQAPFTALLSWWLMNEVPGMKAVWGGMLVILGVTLVQETRAKVKAVSGRS